MCPACLAAAAVVAAKAASAGGLAAFGLAKLRAKTQSAKARETSEQNPGEAE